MDKFAKILRRPHIFAEKLAAATGQVAVGNSPARGDASGRMWPENAGERAVRDLPARGVADIFRAMQWLLHGNMTSAVGEALRRHEHKTHELAELTLPADAPAEEVLAGAGAKQWDLLTTDAALSSALFEQGVRFTRSIVFLQLAGGDVEQDDAVDRLFKRYKRLTPGRLYTVTENRVKVRQLPTKAGG
jgi:hypothetical protein